MPANTPPVDINDSAQNAFVQDWLSTWAREHTIYGADDWYMAADKKSMELRETPYPRSPDDLEADAGAFENVINHIQETYHPQDHVTEPANTPYVRPSSLTDAQLQNPTLQDVPTDWLTFYRGFHITKPWHRLHVYVWGMPYPFAYHSVDAAEAAIDKALS